VLAFAIGLGIATLAMRFAWVSRLVPAAGGAALIACGGFQLTAWKKCLPQALPRSP
jgi:hypothetical protein